MLETLEDRTSDRGTTAIGLVLLTTGLVLNYFFERHVFWGIWGDLAYSATSFSLSLTGVIMTVGGVARASIRGIFPYALSTVIPLSILYVFLYVGVQFVHTGADHFGECTTLCKTAAAPEVVPEAISVPGRAAVFCSVERRGMFLSYYSRLTIYGVTEPAAQELVLRSLSEYYRAVHANPLQVRFFEKENWTVQQKKNGLSSGSRGPEHLIRIVSIG